MKRLLLSLLWLVPGGLFAQAITIDESLTTQELVQDVLIGGSCAETANFTSSTGIDFGDVNGIAAFNANGSDFPFESGIILSSGSVNEAPGPNTNIQSNGGWPGDADLEANTGAVNTNNASSIQFDFTPLTEDLSFNFIMASEEYDQNFECTFSDAFAFILTDLNTGTSENLAVLPGTTIPIQVTNIRPEVPGQCAAVNEEFFDRYNFLPFNDENTAAINFNGQTVTLEASSTVIIGNPYSIKLVVADQGDSAFDIAVFLEAGSFSVGATDLGDDILIANGNAVCEGNSVTLDATDPDAESYTWFLNDVEIAGETMPTLTVTEAGSYSVAVALTDPEDCVINDSIEVEFINQDSVSIGDDVVACEDSPGSFDTGLPEGNATFSWTLDGMTIAGEIGPSIVATSSGIYEVTVSFDDGCIFSDDALSIINITPVVDLGEDINSCLEDPITLDGTPSNIDPAMATYQWALNGGIIAGETAMMLEVTAQGTYEVFVTLDGCTGSDVLIVNLANDDGSSCTINNECPDAIPIACGETISGNTEGSTSEGAPTDFCGTGSGAPGNWYSFIGTGDPVELSLCNSDYDTKIQVYSGSCDTLTCIDGNDDSCGLQSEVEFLSVEGEEYLFYVFGFGSNTGNYELEVTCINVPDACINAEEIACGDTVSGTTEDAPDENIPSDLCGLDEGTAGVWYTISGTNELVTLSLCNSSFDTRINVFTGECNDLTCLATNDDFCDEQSQVEFISQLGIDYLIYISGASDESGDFELVVTCDPQPGCIDADPFCSEEGLIFENVSDGSTAQEGIDYGCLFTQPNPSWFYLEIEDSGDLDFQIVQNTEFDENGNPIGTPLDVDFIAWGPFDNESSACAMLLPENIVDCSYSIDSVEDFSIPNAMEGEIYLVLITNFNGNSGFISLGQTGGDGSTNCDILLEFEVELGDDQVICSDTANSFEISPTITGDIQGDISYLWSTGEMTETITVTESGTYSVEVTADGFTVTDEITVSFNSPTVDLGEDDVICNEGDSFTIIPIVDAGDEDDDDDDVYDYAWSTGETTETITVSESGTYTLTITNDEGCTATDSIIISTESPIAINLGENFQTCRDFPNTLIAEVVAENATYQWFLNGDIIDGATDTTLDFTIGQAAVGTQEYTLEATSALGCTSSETVEVSLYDIGQCVISEGISPSNLDGMNDTLDLRFLADRTGITNLQIYNRLGTLVFEETAYTNQWRGQTDAGDDLPTGTYFYLINFDAEDPDYGTQATGWIYVNQE